MGGIERDTTLITHRIANDIHHQRQREIERSLRLRRNDRAAPTSRPSFRKRVGHGLIHVGSMLAADGPLQLAARR